MLNKTIIASLITGLTLTTAVFATEIKQGGTLTVPDIGTGIVDNFNPYTQKNIAGGVVYEPLFIHDGTRGTIEPRLAESIVVSDDLMSIVIKVRPGLKWSDGQPLTAKDVVYSFNLTKETKAFDVRGMWGEKGAVDRIELADTDTVIIHLTKKDSTFVWNLKEYYVVPEHIWSKVDNLTTFTNSNPVGSGPMTEVKSLNAQQVELCRNPHYWQADVGRPYLDCIITRSYSDNSQIQAALMSGEIDWGSNFIADVDKTFVARDPEHHKYWYPANDAIHLYMNTKQAPLDNLEVRRALSMALDRDAIVEDAAYGYPTPNRYLGGLGSHFASYVNEDIESKYSQYTEFNPEHAMAVLDKAGYVDQNGDGFRQLPNGDPIELTMEVVNGWSDYIQTLEMATQYFENVGINSKLVTVDWSIYDKNLKEGTYTMSMSWSNTANAHPIQAYQDYYSMDLIGTSWHSNHGIVSKELSDRITEFSQIMDELEQKKILDEAQEFTAQNMPFLPLFSAPIWFQYNTTKILGWPDADNAYISPNFYQVDKKVKMIDHLYLRD